jgi:Ala-tRNA(Pro) deacylase
MPVQTLKNYLDSNHVKYVSIAHSPAYTALEIAALTHIPGKELAKTVMVEIDGDLAMAVLPSSHRVDLAQLQRAAGAAHIRLVNESAFRGRFPDCQTGAMPPFGNLYGMRVFVDETLSKDKEIAFNAGSHNELIRLAYEDFERLVRPDKATFTAGETSRKVA